MLMTSAWLVRVWRLLAATALIAIPVLASGGVEPAVAKSHGSAQLNCLTTAIYFEARGESERGQMAVAEVVLARTKAEGRPKTICGVVYEGKRSGVCQFSFACDRNARIVREHVCWQRARRIALEAMRTHRAVVRGATYFHVKTIHPRWASHMIRVARIGTHIFYRPRSA